MNFVLAVAIAASFWGQRGVQVPCHPVAVQNADAQLPIIEATGLPAAMATRVDTCQILISENAGTYPPDKDMAPLYCAEVAHEVGHLGGLEHTATGLMAADGGDWTDIPYECYHWRHWGETHGFLRQAVKPAIRMSVGPGPRKRLRVIRRNSSQAASNTRSLS